MDQIWDAVIWYSPSIFHGPLINSLKIKNGGKKYLIIRDIFPEWAVDMGLMRRGLLYRFFDLVARYQYSLADIIGVQSPGNLHYFQQWEGKFGRKLDVLQNWLDHTTETKCSLRLSNTKLAGRKIFVYAGNMGIAQNMDILLNLALEMRTEVDLGFLFIGRGSEFLRLVARSEEMKLDNVIFASEINSDEIPDLYRQCSAGMISLDPRHKTHNIPGKFLSYMQSGIPVLANINVGNDLIDLIRTERVGQVSDLNDTNNLLRMAKKMILQIDEDADLGNRCRTLFKRDFTAEKAAKQIINILKS